MINVIICDDNEKDRKNVIKVVKDFMSKNKKEYEIHLFDDYNKSFYKVVESKMPFKIYLLDIETPSRSGIDVARDIRKKDVDSVIIFLTAHEELGNIVLKNELMFLSFINKFDDFENRLNNSLKKGLEILKHKNVIRFLDRSTLYTINTNDILYITKESFERKTIIKTDYTEFKVNNTLTEIISMLDDRFIQTHRACYINSDRKVKIDKIKRIITFDNGETIDLLSEKYRKEVC
ncbi:MAG: response regulator transcription factor [Bacilli bacterium]|nr:response regulator transcription factor [Bacilli bacterium]